MKRTFVDFQDDKNKSITLLSPLGKEYISLKDEWNSNDNEVLEEKYKFSSHIEAIEAYLNHVGKLIKKGYLELAPWIKYSLDNDVVEFRPPINKYFEQKVDGKSVYREYESLIDAVYAYNKFVTELIDKNYTFDMPSWDSFDYKISDEFKFTTVYEEDKPELIKRKFYIRLTEPRDEFGPELWYRDGHPWIYNFQFFAKVNGPSIESKNINLLRGIQTCHLNETYGPSIFFSDDGSIETLTLLNGNDESDLILIFKEGKAASFHEKRIDSKGKACQFSIVYYPNKGRMERFYELPSQTKWVKWYDLSNKIIKSQEYDENKAEIGTWIDTEDEVRSVIVYSKPGIYKSITWYSLDDIPQSKNEYDSNGELIKYTLYNENSICTKEDNGIWKELNYYPNTQNKKSEGPLDSEFLRDGIFFIFDEEGKKIGEENWSHGDIATEKAETKKENIISTELKEKSKEKFEEISNNLIKLSSKKASRKGFLKICNLVEEIAIIDTEKFKTLALAKLKENLSSWPSKIKMAPLLWINRLILDILPVEALYLVSSLSFTAALGTESCYDSKFYPLLVDWLKKYPKDGPKIEGLSVNLSEDTLKRVLAEMKDEKLTEIHAEIELGGFNNYMHIDDEDYLMILGSALLSELKVLDFAQDETRFELGYTEQGMSFGRGLKLETVMACLPTEKLEVLDLHGQCWSSSNQIADGNSSSKKLKDSLTKLKNLKKLNLGGGHPIGDKSIKLLVKYATSLEELYLTCGYSAGQLLSFSESDLYEDDDETEYIREEWDVREFSKIKEMKLTKRGWNNLAKLKLKKVVIAKAQEIKDIDCSAEVIVENSWDKSSDGRIAKFEDFFDI